MSINESVNTTEHAFNLLKTKLTAERPKNNATTEDDCSKGLAKHFKAGNSAFGEVHGFLTSGSQ